jgi:nucleoside-diphosphate kinase
VLALVLEGVDVVKTVRKIVGVTYPNEAAPGTVRGDFAHQSRAYAIGHGLPVANLVHASGNVEEAKREVELWFTPAELFSYPAAADAYAV